MGLFSDFVDNRADRWDCRHKADAKQAERQQLVEAKRAAAKKTGKRLK